MRPGAEDALHRALDRGDKPEDAETSELLETARRVESALMVEPPKTGARERALFVQGVASRRHSFPALSLLAPALATAAVVAMFVAVMSRTAHPGQPLYPVREAVADVLLKSSPQEQIDRRIAIAREMLNQAPRHIPTAPGLAVSLVKTAQRDLAVARGLIVEELGGDAPRRSAEIERLNLRAIRIAAAAFEQRVEDNSGPSENSGPGNAEDRSEDNSGPSENSGPGSGDDEFEGDEDSSGGGDGGDDSRGRGRGRGGDDDSDFDDSGGSGSGGDEPERDDSSGSGSDG